MTEAQSIASWRSRTILHLATAQAAGDEQEAARIARSLRAMHIALGERRIGTGQEQATYLLARSTRTALPELLTVGIDTNFWPAPPNSPVSAEPYPASPDTERQITDLFQSAGPLSDRHATEPRYEARYRPQDGQRYKGDPLPWAIWDTQEDLPVAYHGDQELSEYQADLATAAYEKKHEKQ